MCHIGFLYSLLMLANQGLVLTPVSITAQVGKQVESSLTIGHS